MECLRQDGIEPQHPHERRFSAHVAARQDHALTGQLDGIGYAVLHQRVNAVRQFQAGGLTGQDRPSPAFTILIQVITVSRNGHQCVDITHRPDKAPEAVIVLPQPALSPVIQDVLNQKELSDIIQQIHPSQPGEDPKAVKERPHRRQMLPDPRRQFRQLRLLSQPHPRPEHVHQVHHRSHVEGDAALELQALNPAHLGLIFFSFDHSTQHRVDHNHRQHQHHCIFHAPSDQAEHDGAQQQQPARRHQPKHSRGHGSFGQKRQHVIRSHLVAAIREDSLSLAQQPVILPEPLDESIPSGQFQWIGQRIRHQVPQHIGSGRGIGPIHIGIDVLQSQIPHRDPIQGQLALHPKFFHKQLIAFIVLKIMGPARP
ncbi:hypothetical protein DSECCO2_648620 [anaerobic digester metagenome]